MGRARWPSPAGRWQIGVPLAAIFLILVVSPVSGLFPPFMPSVAGPDLVPTIVSLNPAVPFEGDIVRVSVRVENRGDLAVDAARVALRDIRPNGDAIDIPSVSLSAPLAAGRSREINFPPFVAAVLGTHTLRVEVESVEPADADPTNNEISSTFRVEREVVPPPPPPPPDGETLFFVGRFDLSVAAGVAMTIALVVAFARRTEPRRRRQPRPRRAAPYRARRGPRDPPGPDPPDRSPPPIWPV